MIRSPVYIFEGKLKKMESSITSYLFKPKPNRNIAAIVRTFTLTPIFFILLFFLAPLFGQSLDTLWTKTYGGSMYDCGVVVQRTNDGGYIFVGETDSYGEPNGDLWLVKSDSQGTTLWTKTYGGNAGDIGFYISPTLDGGFIITGYTFSYGNSAEVWLLKTDSLGDTLWTKRFGSNYIDIGCCVKQTTDGGYILATYKRLGGPAGADLWLIKTTSNGDTVWTKLYGGPGNDYGFYIDTVSQNKYLILGETSSFGAGGSDIWLLETNATGDTLWTKTYGGINDESSCFFENLSNCGYIIPGYTYSTGAGNADAWILKIDTLGNTIWTKSYGGINYDHSRSIKLLSDGEFIVAGYTYSYGAGGDDIWLLRIDSLGDTLETRTFGGAGGDGAYFMVENNDGTFTLIGWTDSYGAGNDDAWLLKVGTDINISESQRNNITSPSLMFRIFPIPSRSKAFLSYYLPEKTNVIIDILDVLGRKKVNLINEFQSSGYHCIKIPKINALNQLLESGIYFFRLKTDHYETECKTILIK